MAFLAVPCLALLTLTAIAPARAQTPVPLVPNFYSNSCPNAEAIVNSVVRSAILKDAGTAAALLRLHFHDCFVQGCDASVLLDSTDGTQDEKHASINFSLGGFDVVDAIKTALETACPGTVSCADILALAARDAVRLAGGPFIAMKTGRRDGFVSLASNTNTLPIFSNVSALIATFANVGLSTVDMIALSGAHTIGQGHCTSVGNRITGNFDNLMNPTYRQALKNLCLVNGQVQPLVPLFNDIITPFAFDNQYYKNLLQGLGTFITDQLLNVDRRTQSHVNKYASDKNAFFRQFMKSMLTMSQISVLTGGEGEVRFSCRFTNQY